MGAWLEFSCCSKKEEEEEKVKPDIQFKQYRALSDYYISPLEEKYNIINLLSFSKYMNLFFKFNANTTTVDYSYDDPKVQLTSHSDLYNEVITIDLFQSFIENKWIKCNELYITANKDEEVRSVLSKMLWLIYNSLQTKISQYDNLCDRKTEVIKRYHLIPIGILYSCGRNFDKIDFLFNLFKNNNDVFKQSVELDNFLISLFLTPSYCTIFALNKITKREEIKHLKAISEEEWKAIVDAFELKDIMRLVQIFNDTFFGKNEFYEYEEFVEKFKQEDFGWIFSPSGIRYYLQENNDDKGVDLKKLTGNSKMKKLASKLKNFTQVVSLSDNNNNTYDGEGLIMREDSKKSTS